MTLTFREQATLAFIAREFEPAYAVQHAQLLAEACCEKWGHARERYVPTQIGAMTIASPNSPPAHFVCTRCGAASSEVKERA